MSKGRDKALFALGQRVVKYRCKSLHDFEKPTEGYAPAFEGEEEFRSLPFVELHGIRVHYK